MTVVCAPSCVARDRHADLFNVVLGVSRGGGARARQNDEATLTLAQQHTLDRAFSALAQARWELMLTQASALLTDTLPYRPEAFAVTNDQAAAGAQLRSSFAWNGLPIDIMELQLDLLLRDRPQALPAAHLFALAFFASRRHTRENELLHPWHHGVNMHVPAAAQQQARDRFIHVGSGSSIDARVLAEDLGLTQLQVLRRILTFPDRNVPHIRTLAEVAAWTGWNETEIRVILGMTAEKRPVASGRVTVAQLVDALPQWESCPQRKTTGDFVAFLREYQDRYVKAAAA